MVWHQLGFPLADIAALIDDPTHDRLEALRRQLSIARSQLDKFRGITRGLELAIAAFEAGRAMTEDDIFVGFAMSLSEDEVTEPELEAHSGPVSLIEKSSMWSDACRSHQAEQATPVRIAAIDPIRIGETLLALGIVPVGTGTFRDRSTGGLSFPWPDLVEAPIQDRVQGIGIYGTDKELIAKARPDLIVDLLFTQSGQTGSEDHSSGACRHEDLCEIAPTVLLEAPIGPPGFLGRLKQLASVLSVEDRVGALAASWEARTAVLREHISGQTVSALNLNPDFVGRKEIESHDSALGWSPNLDHEAQLFTTLGLSLLPPPEGEGAHWGGAVHVTDVTVCELDAPTLFLTLENQASPEEFWAVIKAEPIASLPAVRDGRVFDLRWTHMRSGWFSAHCQLDLIAQAFGVCRLRTAGSGLPVHLAVDPGGRLTAVSTGQHCVATLRGPRIADVHFELAAGSVSEVGLGDAAAHLCTFPEAYHLTTNGEGTRQLAHDKESALERVTQRYAA